MTRSRLIPFIIQLHLTFLVACSPTDPQGARLHVARDGIAEIDLSVYPKLDAKELGQLRWYHKLAAAELDDFKMIPHGNLYGIPGTATLLDTLSEYRYTLGFTTYFLALEQFHKLPANTSMIRPMFDRMIQKMLAKPVWDYWAKSSRGMRILEPKLDTPYPEERDPVRTKNIMYSGHLFQMISLYEKLFGDLRYSKPGSIVFKYSDKESYVYDLPKIQKLIYEQIVKPSEHCCQCQPNACFPVCNQHAILGLKVYDQVHGTHDFAKASDDLMGWFRKNELTDEQNHQVALMYLTKQQSVIKAGKDGAAFKSPIGAILKPLAAMNLIQLHSAFLDGWNGSFMNAWQPLYVQEHYPFQRHNRVVETEHEAWTKKEGVYDQFSAPFFAVLAAEMGDTELRTKLLAWSDKQFKAEWTPEQGYFYPSWVKIPIIFWPGFSYKGLSMTGSIAAMARANVKNGLSDLHSKPLAVDAKQPMVTKVDFPEVALTRAIYDEQKQALIVSTAPGQGSSIITLGHLGSDELWQLYVDGKTSLSSNYNDSLDVLIDLAEPHDLVLVKQAGL